MPIISGAQTRSTTAPGWRNALDRWAPDGGTSSANGFGYAGSGPHPLSALNGGGAAYDTIFECQLWPNVAITKLVNLQMQLPGKTYERRRRGRTDARTSPFGKLMARPSSVLNPMMFWTWFTLMYQVHGRSFALKGRDNGGRPVELAPIHPTRMRYGPEGGGWSATIPASGAAQGGNRWWFRRLDGTEFDVPRSEFIYWAQPSPRSPLQAMSRLEPLRDTLAMEAAARAANRSLYERGGKHSVVLTTPKNFGNGTTAVLARLADQYSARHGGVLNWGRPLILEDGMQATPLDQSPKDMEYVLARELNRTEVAAAFDIPPPAIGQLEHATYSNVVEQNRTLYRTTMPPHLQSFEAMIDFDLRDGSFGGTVPDFGEQFYFEFLIDGVLRGSTEDRIAANAQAIQTGQLTPAEAREMENREFIGGSDRLFINTAMAPIETGTDPGAGADTGFDPELVAGLVQKLYLGTPGKVVLTSDEARGLLNRVGAGLVGALPEGAPPLPGPLALTPADRSVVMGRLGRLGALADIDDRFTAGLSEGGAMAVLACVVAAQDVADLKEQIKRIGVLEP